MPAIRIALGWLGLMITCVAAGHTADKGFATISLGVTSIQYHYWIPVSSLHQDLMDAMRMGRSAEAPDFSILTEGVSNKITILADARQCRKDSITLAAPTPQNESIGVRVAFTCPFQDGLAAGVTVRDDLSDLLGSTYVTIANIVWPQGSQAFVFKSDAREIRITTALTSHGRSLFSFFTLGVEHILIGWDHLLFLLGLLLLGGRLADLLKAITAFTLSHSLTLAAAALDAVTLPDRFVEAAIALSIAYVAAEGLVGGDRALSRRSVVALVFGFVHGFGFASVLKELGLSTDALMPSLLSFNLGVEAGQALVVAAAMPALVMIRGAARSDRVVRLMTVSVLVVGLALFVHRLMG